WAGIAERMMDRIADVGRMDAAVDIGIAEDVIDRLQDRRSRPERIGERHRIEFQTGRGELPFQLAAPLVELVRCRALEREDRLLLVADREDGTDDAVTRAGAGGELRDDAIDDLPLPGARVLSLVYQYVVDAAVELVMHPARRNALEHVQG